MLSPAAQRPGLVGAAGCRPFLVVLHKRESLALESLS